MKNDFLLDGDSPQWGGDFPVMASPSLEGTQSEAEIRLWKVCEAMDVNFCLGVLDFHGWRNPGGSWAWGESAGQGLSNVPSRSGTITDVGSNIGFLPCQASVS